MEFVILWVALSFVAGLIAGSKGRSGFGYFALSLVLSPLVGLALAFGMPRLHHTPKFPGPGDVEAGARKPCPECAELVLPAAKVCHFCGHRLKVD